MTEEKDRYYIDLLETFDGIGLKNTSERRMAFRPLYDYFQKLMLEVGVQKCGLNDNSFKPLPLGVRWGRRNGVKS